MMTVTEYRTLGRLSEVRELWNELHDQTPYASMFQSYDWYCDFVEHNDVEPRVLEASIAGRTIGLLPLVIRSTDTSLGRARVLTDPRIGWNTGAGVVGPNTAATLFAAMKHLGNQPRDWDLMELTAEGGGKRLRTVNAMKSAGLSFGECETAKTGVVDMSSGWEQFWSTRSNVLKQRFAECEQRLGGSPDLKFERIRSTRELSAAGRDLFDTFLRATRNDAFGSADETPHDTDERQLRNLYERALAAGNVDLCLLSHNGRPLAGAFSLNHSGSVQSQRIGWADGASRDAVDVLLGHMLRDGFERGDREFRFPSVEAGEVDWATHAESSTRLTHCGSLRPRAQLLRLGRWFARRQRDAAAAGRRYDGRHAPTPAPRLRVVG